VSNALGVEEWSVSTVMSMYTDAKAVVRTGCRSVRTGVNANLELVDKFCI